MNSDQLKELKKVAITTLGCKTNQFESAAMTEALERDGYQLVPFAEGADIYIVNTCTVTARTDAESRRLIRRASRWNPEGKIVVTGCYAQLAADDLKELPGVALVMGNREKGGVTALLQELDGGRPRVVVAEIAAEREMAPLSLESFAEHTRAFLQIQNGCNAFCAYCIVPFARGRSRSVPYDEVIDGIRKLVARGFREVVLTGIHLGAYGLDLHPRHELLELLSAVETEGLVERLRVGSVEPNEISPEFIRFLAGSRHICQHLHIPLQSGSATVLERMGRHYNAELVSRLVENLISAVPDMAVGFDVIAGFPGETEDEHRATCELILSLPLSYLHVFPYSSRPGTKAANMPGHLPPAVITSRAEELRRLGEEKKR
ncbi:MAG TPA: tRNA (N(6)-L-threonylcarbamoyladenosine(37)-C(2))-methylthiotransferase MtaB, partial [Geobacteraceae bacterium]|nr:tRNA (N(6)-L-threonylcarbamoyladenosine(37)-C(2))-methylthiotransferase MtaB [Geobacteraceae bacterium]